MTDLVEFLRARLGSDRAEIAKHPNDSFEVDGYEATRETNYPCLEILTIGKKRALREVEAKRRIIDLHQPDRKLPDDWYGNDARCQECGQLWHLIGGSSQPSIPRGCRTLRLLALPYVDHPDYDESWRP